MSKKIKEKKLSQYDNLKAIMNTKLNWATNKKKEVINSLNKLQGVIIVLTELLEAEKK